MSHDTEATRIQARALVLRYAERDYVVPPDFHGLFAIGRGSSCQITVQSNIVSRLHGCIRVDADGRYSYRDTSSNGTIMIDGHDETLVQEEEVLLPESGVLKIGDTLLPFSHRQE